MLRQGNVKLIGEPFPELALGAAPGGPTDVGAAIGPPAGSPQGFLSQQLAAALAYQGAAAGNCAFARIYGFSFEGHYYDLPRPVIMLVTGPGSALPRAGAPNAPHQPGIDQTDEAARFWEFSGNLRQWNYDKKDMSIRLDLDSGTFEDILLARALGDRAAAYGGGSGAYGGGSGAYGGGSGAYGGGSGAYGGGSGAYGGGSGAYGRGRFRGGCD